MVIMLKVTDNPIFRQYFVIVSVNLTMFSVGLGIAWSSPMLVKLADRDGPPLGKPVSLEEGAWIVSIGTLVGALVNFVPALLLPRMGFRYFLVAAMLPKLTGALFLVFGTELWMLILARAAGGISDTILFSVVPMYASEISSKEIRGALSTIPQVMCSLGIVTMLSAGPFISYLAINTLHLVSVVASIIPLLFLPEGPFYLYMKGRTNEAEKLLTLLHGSKDLANALLKEYAIANNEVKVKQLEIFKSRIFWKSLSLVAVIMIGAQIVGYNGITFYLQTILQSTQTSVIPEVASVIIGLIQLIACLFPAVFTDRFGRKLIMCSTLIGMMVGMMCLGGFFYVKDRVDVITGFMNFLPLIGLILVVFSFNAGMGSLIWAITAELFNNKGRVVGLSLSMTINGLFLFLLTRYFPTVIMALGPVAIYLSFSVNCLLMCIFIAIFIPETKGKSFNEIQRELGAKYVTDEEVDVSK